MPVFSSEYCIILSTIQIVGTKQQYSLYILTSPSPSPRAVSIILQATHRWTARVRTRMSPSCSRRTLSKKCLRVFMIERGIVGNPESSFVHRRSPKSRNQSPNSKFLGLSLSTRVWFFLTIFTILYETPCYGCANCGLS